MSVDKLVDSTQLDADLTSVANAIRTKGGTSASLAFPAGFVSAIDAIPSGGGVTAATGEIVIASAISSPGSSASKVFPGLQLDFVPDFLWISLDYDSYGDIETPANNMYLCMAIRHSAIPPYRIDGTYNTDSANYNADYVFLISRSVANGLNGIGAVDVTRSAYWGMNNDGTFSYGRQNSSGTTALYAGTYRYFAIKF